MGRLFQLPVESVGPGVVGADDGGAFARITDELRAAMAAHVVKHAQGGIAPAHDKQRLAENGYRVDVARFFRVIGKTDTEPGVSKEVNFFGFQHLI